MAISFGVSDGVVLFQNNDAKLEVFAKKLFQANLIGFRVLS